jgi:hypothetical protein
VRRHAIASAFLLLLLFSASAGGGKPDRQAPRPDHLRVEVSVSPNVRKQPVDGRLFVVISRTAVPEPRLQISGYSTTSPFFGVNVDTLAPGVWATVDNQARGYPVDHLGEIPTGDYYIQALLNVYETFHRSDAKVIKLHMDQWEGQKMQISPGNLYSASQRIRIDPAVPGHVRLTLDHVIPPVEVPADTRYVKRVRFPSPLLSKFWGRPIYLGATVLLPRDYEQNKGVYYPVNYEQGHFSLAAPGRFSEAQASAGNDIQQRPQNFSRAWLSDDFPRMLYVTFQHPTPYYDDSYAVDSPNVGPYGEAITQELIPYIESHFRAIRAPYARILSGGSTGGWEALALQIFYPDYFGAAYSYCPDPVDFRFFQIVNIYDWPNAWYREVGWTRTPLPGERDADGVVLSTMKQQLDYERALGDRGRSGEQWDAWQASYGPVGDDGFFRPVFDPETGTIDKDVAAYYRDHYDLSYYLRTHWSEVGHKLAGKIHIWVGDMDSFYLNNAVHLLEDFLNATTDPPYGGSVVYGPRKPHCWTGPFSRAEQLKVMAQDTLERAPRDADNSWWKF